MRWRSAASPPRSSSRPPRTEPGGGWGTGTAAVVSPIGELAEGDEKAIINHNEIGPVTQKLYDTLTGIQWGRVPDPHGWIMKL